MTASSSRMRVDTKPFDDVRVRRALNMAVNKQEIVKDYYGGNAELFAYPQHPGLSRLFRAARGDAGLVKELFVYNPAKAKKLLAEAGYPNGFPSRCRSAPARPTTWTCCRWSRPISNRSASRWKSSRWSTARSSRR
jgi:peptide/nickel transport system substrate-binding protein